ncbi:hypothetical protein TcasGA2_TC031962 [Tribolium castaneum]|uniref:Uncharacterized protein n=1 Tax=Tribolium castaneum TaxID=7070 RepID=A0A139WN14_TRICA|nr:hypothetical protein TcasGA2_TC031962 [Tribolium castaneum]
MHMCIEERSIRKKTSMCQEFLFKQKLENHLEVFSGENMIRFKMLGHFHNILVLSKEWFAIRVMNVFPHFMMVIE